MRIALDIFQTLVPVLLAGLLFVQNERSSRREAASRAAERAAEQRRDEAEVAKEQNRVEADGRAAAHEARRRRYVEFLYSVQQIRAGVERSAPLGVLHMVPAEELEHLTRTYEEVRMDAPSEEVSALVEGAFASVIRLVSAQASGQQAIAKELPVLDGWLDQVREAARAHLSDPTAA